MSKRLPGPLKPTQWVIRLAESEAKAVESLAFHAGLSVASFLRTLCVEAARHPRQAKWKLVAEELEKGTDEAPKKAVGRPKGKAKKRVE